MLKQYCELRQWQILNQIQNEKSENIRIDAVKIIC
jgi:hypothetical protein